MYTPDRSRIVCKLASLKQRILYEVAASYVPGIPPAVIEQAIQAYSDFLDPNTNSRLNGRLERGILLAKSGAVMPAQNPRCYHVRSSNGYGSYLVDLNKSNCECPDHLKGHLCKHRIAAQISEFALKIQEAEAQKAAMKAETPPPQPVKSIPDRETIVWAVIKHQDKWLGVEVLNINDDQATVRALPIIKEGNKLSPQFPFADGKSSLDIVPKASLVHVTEFR